VGAALTLTYDTNTIPIGDINVLALLVDFTKGDSSGLAMKVEFSEDEVTWFQEAREESQVYDDSDTVIYQTDAYSGSDDDVTSTEKYSDTIDLSNGGQAVISIKFDGSDASYNLKVNIYASPDGTWDGDEIALTSIVITSDGSEDLKSMVIDGPGYFRLGLDSTGTTTFDVEAKYRATDPVGNGNIIHSPRERKILDTGTLRIILDNVFGKYARVSSKAITSATSAQAGITALIV
jgi:hypothetical protein